MPGKLNILFFMLLTFEPLLAQEEMNFAQLKLVLAKEAIVVKENQNMVEYDLAGIHIYLVTDETNNRMRFMSPIIEQEKLTSEDLTIMMEANFDRALDAKYALFNGVLWSVFAHPLKELRKKQVLNAFFQVKALVDNYGTTYTSSDVVFGGN